jgi:hypothetical protein
VAGDWTGKRVVEKFNNSIVRTENPPRADQLDHQVGSRLISELNHERVFGNRKETDEALRRVP